MFGYRVGDAINSGIFNKDAIKKVPNDLFKKPLAGAIFWVDLGNDINGSVQIGKRPCIVYNNFTQDPQITVSSFVPLTSQCKRLDIPVHFVIRSSITNGLKKDSMVLPEQMGSEENSRLFSPSGMITYEEFMHLEEVMEIQCPMLKYISNEERVQHNQMLKQYFDMVNKAIKAVR